MCSCVSQAGSVGGKNVKNIHHNIHVFGVTRGVPLLVLLLPVNCICFFVFCFFCFDLIGRK